MDIYNHSRKERQIAIAGFFGCLGILAVVLVIVAVFVIMLYNRLVGLKNRAENSWADIDVQLRRRYDLIPNLVETVKGYAGHERETFENVTKARQQAIDVTGDVAKMAQAENFLTQTLRSLFALAEAYPELKANQNFMDLQAQLAEIEDAAAREARKWILAAENRIPRFGFPLTV